MQDEIVARLANALNAQLIIAEARRAERAPSPNSMDLYFRGMSVYNKTLTPDNLSEARKLFERALALDPQRGTHVRNSVLLRAAGPRLGARGGSRVVSKQRASAAAQRLDRPSRQGHAGVGQQRYRQFVPVGPEDWYPDRSSRAAPFRDCPGRPDGLIFLRGAREVRRKIWGPRNAAAMAVASTAISAG